MSSTETIFISGVSGIVIFSIVGGFVQEKIGLIVVRALLGMCEFEVLLLPLHNTYSSGVQVAALTIPSALSLIVYLFPDPKAQAGALGAFGACGAIGNGKLLSLCIL